MTDDKAFEGWLKSAAELLAVLEKNLERAEHTWNDLSDCLDEMEESCTSLRGMIDNVKGWLSDEPGEPDEPDELLEPHPWSSVVQAWPQYPKSTTPQSWHSFEWDPHGKLEISMHMDLPGPAEAEPQIWSYDGLYVIEDNPSFSREALGRGVWTFKMPGEDYGPRCLFVYWGKKDKRAWIYPIESPHKGVSNLVPRHTPRGATLPVDPPAEPPDIEVLLPPVPQGVPEVLTRPRLWIWRELSPAEDFGNPEAVVCSIHGRAGAATVRIICPNGDLSVSVEDMVLRTHKARTEGCAAVCIDLESHFIRKGPRHAEKVYAEVRRIMPLLWAPKAFNDHMIRHWGFSDFEQGARWLGQYGDGQIAWVYSRATATEWLELIEKTHRAGNKDLYVPLGDFAKRGDHTPFNSGAPIGLARKGYSIGSFMPDSGQWVNLVQSTVAWNNAVEVYG